MLFHLVVSHCLRDIKENVRYLRAGRLSLLGVHMLYDDWWSEGASPEAGVLSGDLVYKMLCAMCAGG